MINLVSNEYKNFENSVLILLDHGVAKEELQERLNFIFSTDELTKEIIQATNIIN